MPRGRSLQTNFTAGEFAPRLFGRVDLERYPNGARELMNVVIHPQGGAQRRTGSYYAGEVKDSTARVRLVPFVPTVASPYVVEFGDLYVRFWKNRGQVQAGGVPLEIVTPWPTDILRELRFAQSVDVMYIFHADYQTRKLSRTGTDTFNLALVTFRDGPYQPENTGNPTVAADAGSTTSPGSSPGSGTAGSGGATDTTPDTGADSGDTSGYGGADSGN